MESRKTKSDKLTYWVTLVDRLTVLVSDVLDLVSKINWDEVIHTITSLLS